MVDPGGKFLCVCDLGSDCVWIHELIDAPCPPHAAASRRASGAGFRPATPTRFIRHCPWHTFFANYPARSSHARGIPGGGELGRVSEHPGLPETWGGTPAASAIRVHPSGRAARTPGTEITIRLRYTGWTAGASRRCATDSLRRMREPRDFAFDRSGRFGWSWPNQISHNLGDLRTRSGNRPPKWARRAERAGQFTRRHYLRGMR